jgi:hypothetical protein
MKQKFTHPLSGKIWNTTFGSNYCVLETRDESKRQVSFSCINLLTGNLLWKNISPEKSWWLSLVGVFDEYLFLHKYSSNQKPEPEGLLILNVQTGETIEKLDNWIFFNFHENVLTVYQVENNQPVYQYKLLPSTKLSVETQTTASKTMVWEITQSSTTQQVERHPLNNLTTQQVERHPLNNSPLHYPESSPHFPTIYKFLYRLLNIDAVKAVDYLEINNKIIISYYIYSNKLFQNYLLVTNRERKILLNDLIAETEGIGIDTFSVQSDTLLYVKNENQFIGYEL